MAYYNFQKFLIFTFNGYLFKTFGHYWIINIPYNRWKHEGYNSCLFLTLKCIYISIYLTRSIIFSFIIIIITKTFLNILKWNKLNWLLVWEYYYLCPNWLMKMKKNIHLITAFIEFRNNYIHKSFKKSS